MKRLLAVLLLIGGIASIVAGIGSATWWKPSEEVHATAVSENESGVIMTAPGVLELVNDDVQVSAVAEGHTVDVIVAPTQSVTEWLGERPYAEVTGLTDWENLAVEERNADGEASVVDIAGSDVFNLDNYISKPNRVSLFFTVPEGDWTILAQTPDGVTPTLEMTWTRSVETPYVWWFVVPGLIAALLGGYLFLNSRWEKPGSSKSLKKSKKKGASEEPETELTRDKAASSTGGALGAGIVPASPRADEFRNAELDPADRIVLPVDDENVDTDDQTDDGEVDETPDHAGTETEGADSEAEESAPADEAETEDEGEPDTPVHTDTATENDTPGMDEHHEGEADDVNSASDDEQQSNDDTTTTQTSSDWRSLWGFGGKDTK